VRKAGWRFHHIIGRGGKRLLASLSTAAMTSTSAVKQEQSAHPHGLLPDHRAMFDAVAPAMLPPFARP